MIDEFSACTTVRIPRGASFSNPLEQRAVGWRRQVAEGIADEGLEAGDAAREQLFQVVDGVVAEQAVDAEVDVGRFGRLLLQPQGLDGAGGRVGVGHLEHGRDAAACGRRRTGLPGFLVRIARVAEVHMTVDRARQEVEAVGAHFLARRAAHQVVVSDGDDVFTGDRD